MNEEEEKVNILFVDDEQSVLDSIERIFKRRCKGWTLFFAKDSYKALGIIDKNHIDVLVTDILMPKMQGDVLIKKVLSSHPHIIRIVLSAHSEQEAVTRALSISHQFISKPFDSREFINTLKNVIKFRNEINNHQIIEKINAIDALPVMPDNYKKLMNKLNDPKSSIGEIAKLISNDFSLSAKILQIINSAYFSISREVQSINEAVNFLGIEVVRSICVTSQLFDNYQSQDIKGFSQEALMAQSLKIGNVAKMIAQEFSADASVISNSQLAGFIHNIGMVILADIYPEEYQAVINQYLKNENQLFALEDKAFDASHAIVGAYLLQLWSIPLSIIKACAYYAHPMDYLNRYHDDDFSPLTALHIAKAVHQEVVNEPYFSDPYFDPSYLEALEIDVDLEYYIELTKKCYNDT